MSSASIMSKADKPKEKVDWLAELRGLALMLLAVCQAALTGIYSAALYRYAVSHEVPAGFSGAQLAHAFEPKR